MGVRVQRQTEEEGEEMGCRFDGWFSNDREFIPIIPTAPLE